MVSEDRMSLSIIIPVFNEEENIPHLVKGLKTALAGIKTDYEVIFIDDGSTDNTLEVLKDIHKA